MESGEQCVMIPFHSLMLVLLVDSWDTIIILAMTIFLSTFHKSFTTCNHPVLLVNLIRPVC